MANFFTRLGQRYRQGASDLIASPLRGVDARAMTPTERERFLFSQSTPDVSVERVDAIGQRTPDWQELRSQAEAQVRRNKANANKSTEELQSEVGRVQRELERNYKATMPKQVSGGRLDNADENLMLRALLSDPNDTAMTSLLSDPKFADAVGTSTTELLKARQQLNDAATLAHQLQTQGPTGRAKDWGIEQAPELDALNLVNRARQEPTNANLNAALDAIRAPQVTRTRDPYSWEADADIGVPWSVDDERRHLPRQYRNPISGEMLDRGTDIEPPGDPRLVTEPLNVFLNRAYGVTSDTASLKPSQANPDFTPIRDLSDGSPAAQAWKGLEQLRDATAMVEDIGMLAAERAGAQTKTQKLRRLEDLLRKQGNKTGDKANDFEVQKAARDLFDLENRQMSDQERERLVESINQTRPGVLDDALKIMSQMPKTLDLDGAPITAEVMRAAERAGVGFGSKAQPTVQQFTVTPEADARLRQQAQQLVNRAAVAKGRQTAELQSEVDAVYQQLRDQYKADLDQQQLKQRARGRQFKTEQAQHLHDFVTDPRTGYSVASLGALAAAATLAASIRGNQEYEYDYTRKESGEPFSNSIRDEALYRMRMADPAVIQAAIQAAENY